MKRALDQFKINVDIFGMFVGILFIEILFRLFMNYAFVNPSTILFDISIAIFLSSFQILMGKKTRLTYSIILFLFLGILSAGQLLHYQYFSTFFSFSKASILQEFTTVSGEVTSKIQWQMILFFVPVLLSILCFIFKGNQDKYKWKTRVSMLLVSLVVSCGCMFFITNNYPDNPTQSKSTKFLYSTLYNKSRSIDTFGFYGYEIKDFGLTFIEKRITDETRTTISLYINEHGYTANSNDYTNLFKGKNLVLILCESLGTKVIDEELTPTLYKLQTEGINFSNHYAPVYQTATFDSEFISLTGEIPSMSEPICYNYYKNSFPNALPSLFIKNDYDAHSFHAFEAGFYNRDTVHHTLGFYSMYGWEAFDYTEAKTAPEGVEFQNAINWVHDKYLAQNIVKETQRLDNYPFFNFMISVTGHMPYVLGRYELTEDLWKTKLRYGEIDEKYSAEVLVYLAAQRTLDDAVGELISGYEAQGILDDTVFILYGDHYPYGLSDDAYEELYEEKKPTDYSLYNVPFIIWTPDIEAKNITKVTSTFDIYPTICNLFGLDIEGNMIVGHDALDDSSKDIVIFPDYSWLTDDAYYNAVTQKVTKFTSISDKKVQETTDSIFEAISISQDIIQTDYFKETKETDDK